MSKSALPMICHILGTYECSWEMWRTSQPRAASDWTSVDLPAQQGPTTPMITAPA
jgi:hypothetical protein